MQPNEQVIFIGYAAVEELLDRRDRNATQIYLFTGVETQSTRYGNLHGRTYYLVVSLIDDGAVHYCRVPYGAHQVVTDHVGQPVGDCQREVWRMQGRGDTLEAFIKRYIARLGFAPPREASPSFPAGLRLIEGTQRLARLNEDKTAFVAIGEEAASS